jgi:hypothetical protein
MMDDSECEAVSGMIGKRNQCTRRKPTPVPLCPPQIPHDVTQTAAVGIQRLTAWAVARILLVLDLVSLELRSMMKLEA